jgi:flagellar basal-body rod protein FlgB
VVSRIDNALSFQQQALGLRAYRQEVLAGNIANADTPNYKARDFDFSTALKDAVAGRTALAMDRTSAGHLPGNMNGGPTRLMYRTPVQASVDGNTVEMDVERAQFAENALRYQAGLTFITGKIKTLSMALQSQ